MTDAIHTAWEAQRAAMGAFIRSQREMANMSLRELSRVTQVSNAYLSQIERGMHDPTLKVLLQIGDALHMSVDEMLERGGRPTESRTPDVEDAIRADAHLEASQKDALITVYRSYKATTGAPSRSSKGSSSPSTPRPAKRSAARAKAPTDSPGA